MVYFMYISTWTPYDMIKNMINFSDLIKSNDTKHNGINIHSKSCIVSVVYLPLDTVITCYKRMGVYL